MKRTTPSRTPKHPALVLVLSVVLVLVCNTYSQSQTATPALTLTPSSETGARPQGRSAAIYPPQSLPLRFSHSQHLALSIPCTQCHTEATTSIRTRDRLLPSMETCVGCHTLENTQNPPNKTSLPSKSSAQTSTQCATCHPVYDTNPPQWLPNFPPASPSTSLSVIPPPFQTPRVANPPPKPHIPTAALHFSHRRHHDANISCETCHGDLHQVELANRSQLPTMQLCLNCHNGEPEAPSDTCRSCHLSTPSGRLKTDLPTGTLIPSGQIYADDHRFDFLQHHAQAARDPKRCSSCHTESFCLDCHAGSVKPLQQHPPGYAQLHSIDAQMNPLSCQGCHNAQQFCLSCHSLTDTTPDTRPRRDAFHPSGFIDQPGTLNFHGPQAQRNINACVSCHQEQTCIRCHAGVNPHGPSFLAKCSAMRTRNESSCIRCHTPSSQELLRLRSLCP